MNIEFTRIEGKSNGFYYLVAALALTAAAGMYSTFVMVADGLYLTGMTNRVPWGLSIVMAVYYIGLSAGSLVMSAMSAVFGKAEFKPFSRIAALLAMLLLVGALMSIMLDWGRPDRLFIPFQFFNPTSMFSINAFFYSSYIGICVVYLIAMFLGLDKAVKVIAYVAVIWAVGVHSGTGAIFGFVPRELLTSPLLPPSFIAAALSSGTAMMILALQVIFKATNRRLDDYFVKELGKLMGIFILVVVYFIFIENSFRAYQAEAREAEWYFLLGGFHSAVFWLGLVIMGLVLPLIIVFNPATGKCVKWINAAATMQVLGVLCERYVIVIPGQTHAADLLPGMTVSSAALDGVNVPYNISFLEIVQALGIASIVLLAFVIGIRLFAMVPTHAMIETAGHTDDPCGCEAGDEEDEEAAPEKAR